MADSEVFDVPKVDAPTETHELVEVKKKGRKPMSAERKAELVERLRLGREKKKALKLAGKLPPKKEKKEKIVEVLPATTTEPAVLVKNVRKTNQKNYDNDINALRAEIAEMKLQQNSKQDLAEIKELKSELKAMRDQKKKDKLVADKVVKVKEAKPKVEMKIEEAKAPKPVAAIDSTPPIVVPKPAPRYSTYKKSIWSQLL